MINSEVLVERGALYIRVNYIEGNDYIVTILFGYILHSVCFNLYCGCFILFCNLCVCFVKCGRVCVRLGA